MKIALEWLRAGEDDLEVIREIIYHEQLTHIVAFHAQKCVEKSFKALLEMWEMETPKIYSLGALFTKIEDRLDVKFKEGISFERLKLLDSLYVEARYPSELGLLPNGKPTLDDAQSFYDFGCPMATVLSVWWSLAMARS